MPKVHGTGVSDSKRPMKSRGSKLRSLTEIHTDRLSQISEENWATTPEKPFDSDLVKEIYDDDLMRAEDGGGKAAVLEVSRYLEKYLWPNFHRNSATFEHVMSMMIMVNEKIRRNVDPWVCFHDRTYVFEKFIERVLRLRHYHGAANFSVFEKTTYLLFITNSLQGSDKLVRKKVSSIAGIQCWHSLSDGRLKTELTRNPSLLFNWKHVDKRDKDWKSYFLLNLIEEFLNVLGSEVFFTSKNMVQVNEACVLYCERFMQFLVDLSSQLPAGRYIRVLVADISVVEKCRLSDLYRHERGELFSQLVDSLQFYEK